MPAKVLGVFKEVNKRYRICFGGRGSGKSRAFCTMLLVKAMEKQTRILCTRELQTSIKDSVHKLLCDLIHFYKLPGFKITRESIIHTNGSNFIFKGLRNNINEIRSLEGVDICFIEEAATISETSWNVLVPTIRKPDSEIWAVFNPTNETDVIYDKFVINTPPKNAVVVECNWSDNPWFPSTLRDEMDQLKKTDYDMYRHVYEGELRKVAYGEPVFRNYFNKHIHLGTFEPDPDRELLWGMDFGNTSSVVLAQEDRDNNLIILAHIETKGLKTDQTTEKVLHFINNEWSWNDPKITVYCDTMGKAEHSSAYQTDYDMLNKYGLYPVSDQQKGQIVPGLDVIKTKFMTLTSGIPGIRINQKHCKHLIEALEIGYCYPKKEPNDIKAESRLPNKDGIYDHCMDALRYLCWNRYKNLLFKTNKKEINQKEWDEFNNDDPYDYFD